MRVSHVALDDFRSYRHVVVEFPRGTTVLVGRNGQGKTNLVEAVAYLSSFSSHRVAADTALVRVPPADSGEVPPGGSVIRVKLVTGEGSSIDEGGKDHEEGSVREQVIELEIVRGRANRARLNRTQVRPRDIVGVVRTVVFAPEDLSIVRGDPAGRRQFLDEVAIQLHPMTAQVKSDFEKVARQRGALMKQAAAARRRGRQADLSTLEVWDQRFADLSARLTAARLEVVEALKGPVAEAYDKVADSPRELTLALVPSVQGGTAPNAVLEALAGVRDREVERGVNLVGAHRDDLELILGGLPVRGYASHGESWSVALALRLGSFEVLGVGGEEPILILDDVFAELDRKRREGLAKLVADADQVLVTAAVPEDVPELLDGYRLHVEWDAQVGTTVQEDGDA